MKVSLKIVLPDNFRRVDFLSFHQRDIQMLSEQWDEKSLSKGIMWDAMPACLHFRFSSATQLSVSLDIDSARKKIDAKKSKHRLRQLATHMLGLNQATTSFESFAKTHHDLKTLVAKQAGLRVPQSASPFEALSWAIIGQQISLGAAISLRRKLIKMAGVPHSSGIICYPDPAQILLFNQNDLRNCSFSQTKANTLLHLVQLIHIGELPLDQWINNYWHNQVLDAEHIYAQLIKIRGIGPWTIHYALLRGFGWLDGSLHGDVAVRRNLQRLLSSQQKSSREEKISEAETQKWLTEFSPWRALVAAHLWAM